MEHNDDSNGFQESKIKIIVTDHESNTNVLEPEQGQVSSGEKGVEVNPWAAQHTFPLIWICTVVILGRNVYLR